jgi:hypothetical protein
MRTSDRVRELEAALGDLAAKVEMLLEDTGISQYLPSALIPGPKRRGIAVRATAASEAALKGGKRDRKALLAAVKKARRLSGTGAPKRIMYRE